MNPNPEVWGAPDTWVDQNIMQTTNSYPALKAGKAKVASFRNLNNGNTQGKTPYPDPIDKTICAVGQDPAVSCFGKLYVISLSSIPSTNVLNPEVVKEFESPVNWCFAEGGPGTQGWTIRDYWTASTDFSNVRWSPNTGTVNTNLNRNVGICPFVYYQLKTLLLSIKVQLIDGYSDNYYGNMPYTSSGWITLADWKNNYPNKKAYQIAFEINSVYNADTNNITYQNYSTSMGSFDTVSVALLDGLELKSNDNTLFYDYATYQIEAKTRRFKLVNSFHNTSDANRRNIFLSVDKFENSVIKTTKGTSNDYVYCAWQEIPYTEKNYETIMKMVACFGVPFTDTNKLSFKLDYTDNELCLPIIDANGVAHGEYTRGQANTTNDLYNADSVRDKNYDPAKPPRPTPSSDPITPFSPGLTLAGAGTGLWAMTRTDVKETINDIFGGEAEKLKDKLALFGNNPMNAIISLKWYPMAFSSTVNGPVILGTVKVNNSHTYPVINSTANSLYENNGTLDIMNAYEKNFYNSRNIQARLWLPFYGFYELPTSILLSKQIELTLHYNLPDELGVWIISFDNVIYDYCECAMGIDIPLTGSNAAAISEAKRQAALQIASQIATTAATVITGYAGVRAAAATAGAIQSIGLGAGIGIGEAMGGEVPGAESILYGMKGANRGLNISSGLSRLGAGFGSLAGGTGIFGTIHQTRLDIAGLRTNIPFHGAAGQTTFLNLPMYPYIQIFRNNIMSIYDEDEYKLKVGHACDVWETIDNMPDNSLLQTTGVANMSSMSMELSEYQELNSILQTGFFK